MTVAHASPRACLTGEEKRRALWRKGLLSEYNQLQEDRWTGRKNAGTRSAADPARGSELLNYFLAEFVQGFRRGHSVILAEMMAQINSQNRAVSPKRPLAESLA